jgi:hypothetical protein
MGNSAQICRVIADVVNRKSQTGDKKHMKNSGRDTSIPHGTRKALYITVKGVALVLHIREVLG